jgi:alpha-beta hydrolase superfamily lysophospholipase
MQVSHYYVTPDDGVTRLHVCRILPETEPRFVLQIVHGIAERAERYLPLLSYIASCGGIAVIHDLRGHGHSAPNARLLGHCGDLYETYRADIDLVYASVYEYPADGEVISPRLPETYEIQPLPRYLFGFSMGALIAGLYAAESSAELAGLILAGLPRRQPLASLGIAGMEILTLFCGERAKPLWFHNRAFRNYNRNFTPEPESDGQFLWLSNDIGNREAFRDDPLCNRPNSLGMYRTMLKFVRDLYRPASWNMDRRDLPLLLAAGEYDPVTGGAKWRKDSAKFLADMGYTDIRTKVYPGLRHEIYHDTGREVPFADVIGFIDETIAADNARRQRKMDEYQSMFT